MTAEYNCPWSWLNLFFQYIEFEMLYGKITECKFVLSADDKWDRGWVSSPFCPPALSCLAHRSARNLSVWVFLCFIFHVALPRVFRAGLSLLVAATIWTSLCCWSLLEFAADISQQVNQCCAVEAKSYEIWKKGYGRVCRSVPSVCPTLADLKELLSSVSLPHSSLACECSFPVPSAWLWLWLWFLPSVALDPDPHTQSHSGLRRPEKVLLPFPNISACSFPMSGMTVIQQ